MAFYKATKKSIDTSLFEMLSMDFNSKKKFVSYPIFKFFNRSAAISISLLIFSLVILA